MTRNTTNVPQKILGFPFITSKGPFAPVNNFAKASANDMVSVIVKSENEFCSALPPKKDRNAGTQRNAGSSPAINDDALNLNQITFLTVGSFSFRSARNIRNKTTDATQRKNPK